MPEDGEKASVWPEAPEPRPRIAGREYNGEIIAARIHRNFRFPSKQTLVLQIRIYPDGPTGESVILPRFLNYYARPEPATDYYKEWVKANGGRAPARRDRMWPKLFVGKLVRVRVRTVVKDLDGDDLPGELPYSVVGKILGLL